MGVQKAVQDHWGFCHVRRATEEENGRAIAKVRAGERRARVETVRWRNIVLCCGGEKGQRRGCGCEWKERLRLRTRIDDGCRFRPFGL